MRAVVSDALERIQDALHAPATTMRITIGAPVIPQIGVGGGTDPRDGRVTIAVAQEPRVGLREALRYRVRVTMAHELNHAKRILQARGCWAAPGSLADALVCEGLA